MRTINMAAFTMALIGWLGLVAQGSMEIYFIDQTTHILALIWLPIIALGFLVSLCMMGDE